MATTTTDISLLHDTSTAISNLQAHSIQLRDDQPSISSASVNVDYDVSFETNFVDRIAFASGVAKYVEAAQHHAELVSSN